MQHRCNNKYLLVQCSKCIVYYICGYMSNKRISLKEYADKHNPKLNRRGHKMSEGYLYRLIRNNIKGTGTTALWFNYTLEGDKQRIFIEL